MVSVDETSLLAHMFIGEVREFQDYSITSFSISVQALSRRSELRP